MPAKDRNNNTVTQLPMMHPGSEKIDEAPGEWANRLIKHDFEQTSTKITILRSEKPLREPITRKMDAAKLDAHLTSSAPKLEAALVQIVGNVAEHACNNCAAGYGPFMKCVTLKSDPCCANCYFNGMGKQCSFRTPSPSKKRKQTCEKAEKPEKKKRKTEAKKRKMETTKHRDQIKQHMETTKHGVEKFKRELQAVVDNVNVVQAQVRCLTNATQGLQSRADLYYKRLDQLEELLKGLPDVVSEDDNEDDDE